VLSSSNEMASETVFRRFIIFSLEYRDTRKRRRTKISPPLAGCELARTM